MIRLAIAVLSFAHTVIARQSRLRRLMCGEGYAPQLAYNQAMGFALGSGSALKLLGRRPNEGHSPKISKAFSARRSLRRTSGGEAAQPHAFCKVAALILIALLWTTATAQQDDRYRIGPSDVLDVRIHNRPQISREAVRVEGNGMIRMPLIESEIQAACLTEGELAKEIATRYAKYYRNLQVDVFIKEYHSKQVAIIGAVNDQSRFKLQRRVRLLELLTYAKGPSTTAGQTINIVHSTTASPCKQQDENGDVASVFSTYKLSDVLRGDPTANPYLEAGDIITVPEADQVYVVGNVFMPLTIPLREPVTLTRAIAMAGGLKQDTKKDKIRVLRQEPGTTTRKEITVDLSAIEKKRSDDLALLPNDIVDVPTSAGKSFLRSLVQGVVPGVGQLPVRVVP
ncbi:MAG TPA: polysaccharide biosynthesis/export family protein [Pyrinomonadaceae bacterium]|nr:polysaccharide biosynthesis/export family protein [Pyrinomonadaceae bacterium]